MLYELLSPSIELEIDRALDCSPMSVSTANPILRRLGVAGGGSDRHYKDQTDARAWPLGRDLKKRKREDPIGARSKKQKAQ